MFTEKQYDDAIEALIAGKRQLLQGTQGKGCDICGGSCHPDQCGHNPLYAMHLCETIAKQSEGLHQTLHYLMGVMTQMGEPVGPGRVVLPAAKDTSQTIEGE